MKQASLTALACQRCCPRPDMPTRTFSMILAHHCRDLLPRFQARKPNYWRAITRIGCGSSGNCISTVTTALRGSTNIDPDREPRRRACLAFVCLVCRPLRCGDLGVISALTS